MIFPFWIKLLFIPILHQNTSCKIRYFCPFKVIFNISLKNLAQMGKVWETKNLWVFINYQLKTEINNNNINIFYIKCNNSLRCILIW